MGQLLPPRGAGGGAAARPRRRAVALALVAAVALVASLLAARWAGAREAGSGFSEDVMRGGVALTKVDLEGGGAAQGDASLAGAEFEVVNRSPNAVAVDGEWREPGEVVATLVTDGQGRASTAADALPVGSYEVRETKAPDGYLLPQDGASQTVTVESDGQVVECPVSFADQVARGDVEVGKVDRETGQPVALGEASLAGATFEITNDSPSRVRVGDEWYGPGEVCCTVAAQAADDGASVVARTTGGALPYGSYTVREASTGEGYLLDASSSGWSYSFQIREDGQVVDATGPQDAASNQAQREDFSFSKKDEASMERMGGVAFLVTSKTTGERHVVVTDENGTWGSSWAPHTRDTNANDPDSPDSNGAVTVGADGAWVVTDSSALDPGAGTWFTGMPDDAVSWTDATTYEVGAAGRTTTARVDDSLRAFPYDTYSVQELRCDANEGRARVSFTVTLHRYGAAGSGGVDLDYGTIDDKTVSVATTLTADGAKVAPATGDATLTDVVSYDQLTPGTEYRIEGELHAVDADGGDGGVVASASKTITPESRSGSAQVTFDLDASALGGRRLVAFERVLEGDAVVASHEDLDDEGQSVDVAGVGTTLSGDVDHEADAGGGSLTDAVAYEGLAPGAEYVVTGTLMDRASGEAVMGADGQPVTATRAFTPPAASGTVDVTFDLSGVEGLAGRTVVAFERILEGDAVVASHEDLDDEGQTVTFPSLRTTLSDAADGDHEVAAADERTVVDAVECSNLVAGKEYVVTGTLHVRDADGSDAGALTDAQGEPVTATATFTADGPDASVELRFTFDASALAGRAVVAFEELSRDGVTVATHADIHDEDQTVGVPSIATTLTNAADGTHEASAAMRGDASSSAADAAADSDGEAGPAASAASDAARATLTDAVAYEGLEPGAEYVVTGTLHVRGEDGSDAGALTDAQGEPVTATTTFTPRSADGTVEVDFDVDARDLAGESVVAFEELSRAGATVATHADIDDEGQTVAFPGLRTTLTDASDGDHEAPAAAEVTLTDKVEYRGLTPGEEYVVTGTLHVRAADGSDEGALTGDDGEPVTASATFAPQSADGSVELSFTFDTTALAGDAVVAFEDLTRGGTLVAVHADIHDEDQTVTVGDAPRIATTLSDAADGDHEVAVAPEVTLTDTVAYDNLVPGTEYVLSGTIMDKSTKAAATDAQGGEVSAQTTFTPEEPSGTARVTFTLDTTGLAGHTLVAFERLGQGDATVATHEDLSDEGQAVTVGDAPRIATTLTSAADGTHQAEGAQGMTLVDAVDYDNLVPGTEYVLSGTLMDKASGSALRDAQGREVSAQTTFTPEEPSGTARVTFTFDGSSLAGDTGAVAFESAATGGKQVASHSDINDEAQLVTVTQSGGASGGGSGSAGTLAQTGVGPVVAGIALVAVAALAGIALIRTRSPRGGGR